METGWENREEVRSSDVVRGDQAIMESHVARELVPEPEDVR